VTVAAPVADPVRTYAAAVGDGSMVAGPLVRLACKRHLDDLAHGAERGLVWDQEAADHALSFFGFLRLSEGAFAGQEFELLGFEAFIVGSLFGWKSADGFRRFRIAYIEIGKGNGKTPLAAGIGLYGLVADDEASAEIYTAGVTRDQANYILRDARKFVEASPGLSSRVEVTNHNLAVLATDSYMRGVSSEARSLDQKRVHMALIDEIHEHPNSAVVDKMRAGTKGRRQALIFEITNAGYDRHSVCWQHHEYSRQVLEGAIPNDAWFAFVAGLDEGDEWTDEAVWPKANPGLGVTITHRYLREQVDEAIGMPAKANIVKRLHFCIWTEQATRWLPMEAYDACDLVATPAPDAVRWGGLDLSTTTDLTAFVLLGTHSEPGADGLDVEITDVRALFWCPEEGIALRSRRDHVPYQLWADQGWIIATPGNVVDYAAVAAAIEHEAEDITITQIGADRWHLVALQSHLDTPAPLVEVGQGYRGMAGPMQELERLVVGRTIRFGANPVLRWMASNLAVESDPAGNLKPSKDKSTERIDGMSALLNAIAVRMAAEHAETFTSVYETRGVMTLEG
jgi:phage terminase large subunit-like protein